VRGLLEKGDTVVVPSRSEGKLDDLKAFLSQRLDASALSRLHTFLGDIAAEGQGEEMCAQIERAVGAPHAAIASLGRFQPCESLLRSSRAEMEGVMNDYLYAHFAVARRFLPRFSARGGTYVFVNGPLAFQVWEGSALVSIATSAQHMLFRSLARELAGTQARVIELVNYAFVRDKQTQPSSAVRVEEVAACLPHLLWRSDGNLHGQSVHLRDATAIAAALNHESSAGEGSR
jgi:NAD(P)-dependent dehydrogenase (short-subunit alcohol dehydrogenase family)